MNDLTKHIQLIFVVETNAIVKSDNAYIVWLLKKTYEKYINQTICDGLFFSYTFVYMDGKTKYNKASVIKDINLEKKLSPHYQSIVIYCIDLDGQDKEDNQRFEDIKAFTKKNDYYLVAFYREIEDVMKINTPGSKFERVKSFLDNYLKFTHVSEKCLRYPLDKVMGNIGCSNFDLVIDEIIKKVKN